jgi:hypothetical protein
MSCDCVEKNYLIVVCGDDRKRRRRERKSQAATRGIRQSYGGQRADPPGTTANRSPGTRATANYGRCM